MASTRRGRAPRRPSAPQVGPSGRGDSSACAPPRGGGGLRPRRRRTCRTIRGGRDDAVTEGGEQVLAVGGARHRARRDRRPGRRRRTGPADWTRRSPAAELGAGTAPGGAAWPSGTTRPLRRRCGRRSAAAAKPPRASAVMAWAWPNPEPNGAATSTRWPRPSAPRPTTAERDLDGDRRRAAAGPRVSKPVRPPRSAQRGEATASAGHAAVDEQPPRPAGGSAVAHRRPSCRTRQPARRRAWPSPGTACGGRRLGRSSAAVCAG